MLISSYAHLFPLQFIVYQRVEYEGMIPRSCFRWKSRLILSQDPASLIHFLSLVFSTVPKRL